MIIEKLFKPTPCSEGILWLLSNGFAPARMLGRYYMHGENVFAYVLKGKDVHNHYVYVEYQPFGFWIATLTDTRDNEIGHATGHTPGEALEELDKRVNLFTYAMENGQ